VKKSEARFVRSASLLPFAPYLLRTLNLVGVISEAIASDVGLRFVDLPG
jgi:hypothetical protein